MAGIRLGNKRKGSMAAPVKGETVIHIDRGNPLGNRHYLKDVNDDVERDKVIELFRQDYKKDWLRSGPMSKATIEIAQKVKEGQDVILMCWCHPKNCHGNEIIENVKRLL